MQLLTLRQTCVHPGVGIRNQRQLGSVVHTLPEGEICDEFKSYATATKSSYSAGGHDKPIQR